ncbi:MAG: hypothetical protein R3C59_00070 [Planctomycetaceae bacterium]
MLRSAGFAALMLFVLTGNPSAVFGQTSEAPIVRVEEDWVAYIRNPDENVAAPQLVHVISPLKHLDGPYGLIEFNHRSQPSFQEGGFQVQSWQGDDPYDHRTSAETNLLDSNYDKLTYTIAMETDGSQLKFTLKDGRSRSWGRFAHSGVTAVAPAVGSDLRDYSPDFSAAKTTVNVGAHRAEIVYMKAARYYSSEGLVREDLTPRVLHRYLELIQFVSLEEYEANADYFNIDITEAP